MSNQQQPDLARREFIGRGTALAATGVVLAPGVVLYGVAQAKPADEAVSSKNRWGMLVDTSRCSSDCNDCVTACNKEQGLGNETHSREGQRTQYIRKVELHHKATEVTHSLPVMCQHCWSPPCVDVCPTGASFKRADGIVLVDRHICIGCRFCMMACPYKARSFVHETLTDQKPHNPRGKGCVEACNLCVHRVDEGREPACVEACAANGSNAIIFGDLNDPNSDIAQRVKKYASSEIRADLGLNTGVRYQGI